MEREIFALIVGRSKRNRCTMFHMSPHHDEVELVYPFWVIREGSRVTLIDTGFASDVAQARGIYDFRDPTELLAAIGAVPGDVHRVILSHLHYDHFGVPDRFPNATFVVQRDDVEYFTSAGVTHHALKAADGPSLASLAELRRTGRLQELDGSTNLEGALLVHVGGHTPGSQLTVLHRDGVPLVIACDASHFYDNCRTRTPSVYIHSYDDYQRGFSAIEAFAQGGVWLPGHDPVMLESMHREADCVYRVSN